MRAATIYERKGKLYVHSSSKTTAGVWVINAPVLAVEKEDTSEVGRAVRECRFALGSCNMALPEYATNNNKHTYI